MKKLTIRTFCLMLFVCGIFNAKAQTAKEKQILPQERTLMGKFEPDYVVPVNERIGLKEKRVAYQKRTKKILDTLDISDRKRRKLMLELKKNPFSERINKALLTETKFEDDQETSNN